MNKLEVLMNRVFNYASNKRNNYKKLGILIMNNLRMMIKAVLTLNKHTDYNRITLFIEVVGRIRSAMAKGNSWIKTMLFIRVIGRMMFSKVMDK